MKVNKKIVDMEIGKLVNMSRLLTEDKIKEKIIYIIENYLSSEGGILYYIENGLLNIVGVDY